MAVNVKWHLSARRVAFVWKKMSLGISFFTIMFFTGTSFAQCMSVRYLFILSIFIKNSLKLKWLDGKKPKQTYTQSIFKIVKTPCSSTVHHCNSERMYFVFRKICKSATLFSNFWLWKVIWNLIEDDKIDKDNFFDRKYLLVRVVYFKNCPWCRKWWKYFRHKGGSL